MTIGEIMAPSTKAGFMIGIMTTAFSYVLIKSDLELSLDCGLAMFAGTTAFCATMLSIPPKTGYIDYGVRTQNFSGKKRTLYEERLFLTPYESKKEYIDDGTETDN